MALTIEDQLKHYLIPGWLYYPYKLEKETRHMEPEVRILRELVPADRIALDIGANRGYYSYALSKIASRVEAFEPHPALARFHQRKLGGNVRLHEVALSNRAGSMKLYIPQRKPGIDGHIGSSLKKIYETSSNYYSEVAVSTRTLDDYGFDNVGFIKIDVEGADMDVIEGGQATIARNRPNMVVELVGQTHSDPLACIDHIDKTFGYRARIMVEGRLEDAEAVLKHPPAELRTHNVVFTPL
jgi:FkbM family methyltransferase